jgi:aspartate/tyrosine/aromatic aminotransferase
MFLNNTKKIKVFITLQMFQCAAMAYCNSPVYGNNSQMNQMADNIYRQCLANEQLAKQMQQQQQQMQQQQQQMRQQEWQMQQQQQRQNLDNFMQQNMGDLDRMMQTPLR